MSEINDAHEDGKAGGFFSDFLSEQGIRDECESVAIKRVIAFEIEQSRKAQKLSKSKMAELMHTSRPQLDRLLDPNNDSVTLSTLVKAAQAIGKNLEIRLA